MAYIEVRVGRGRYVRSMIRQFFFHVQVYDQPFTGGDNDTDTLLLESYEQTAVLEGNTRF